MSVATNQGKEIACIMSGIKRKWIAKDQANGKRKRLSSSKDHELEHQVIRAVREAHNVELLSVIAQEILSFGSGDWTTCSGCGELIDIIHSNWESPGACYGLEAYCDDCVWPGTFSYWRIHIRNEQDIEYVFTDEADEQQKP